MHRYSFRIFYKDELEYIHLTIVLYAETPHAPYEKIIIQDFDEGPENWSTSIKEMYEKEKIVSSAAWFFNWLWSQHHPGLASFGPVFTPRNLYFQLNRPDSKYHCFFYTDDLTFHKSVNEKAYEDDDDDDCEEWPHYDPHKERVY